MTALVKEHKSPYMHWFLKITRIETLLDLVMASSDFPHVRVENN